MKDTELSDRLARLLSWVWTTHRQRGFLDYLAASCFELVGELPGFEKICVMEADYGYAAKGIIGNKMKRWWVADKDGFRSMQWIDMPPWREDFSAAGATGRMFYRFPVVKFLREGGTITFEEAFGPQLIGRKVGRVHEVGNNVSIVDVRLVGNVPSVDGNTPLPQMLRSLDISDPGTRPAARCV